MVLPINPPTPVVGKNFIIKLESISAIKTKLKKKTNSNPGTRKDHRGLKSVRPRPGAIRSRSRKRLKSWDKCYKTF